MVDLTFICKWMFCLGMAQQKAKLADVETPSESQIINQVAKAADTVDFKPSGPAYDPFHSSKGAESHCNTLHQNSAAFPDTLLDGRSIGRKTHKMAQHLYDTPPIESGAYVVDHLLSQFEDMAVVGKRFILNKVAGAFVWKIGVMEEITRQALCAHYDLIPAPRALDQVAKDEANNIDLRLVKEDGSDVTVQVKVNVDKPDIDGVDMGVVIDTEKETLTIYE